MASVESAAAVEPLDDLRATVERTGPFVSVYMTMEEPAEDAKTRTDLRWRAMREHLAEIGAPSGALDAIGEALHAADPRASAFGAVSTERGLVVSGTHLAPLRGRDISRFEPVPSLVQMVEWRQLTPPHVVVAIDRTGADVTVVGPDASAAFEVEGDHNVINKPSQGGWSHQRVQQRAEDSWERNAEQVAGTVARLVGAVEARLVIAAGDPSAVTFFESACSDEVRRVLRVISGSRHQGVDQERIDEEILHLVASAAAEDTVALLDRLRQETTRDGGAVEGVGATAEALRKAQVNVLALHDDPDDDRRLWFGPSPEQVAVESQTLRDLGVSEPRQGRMADVVLRAALGTGAGVRIIPAHGGPADGVGALLRWEDEPAS